MTHCIGIDLGTSTSIVSIFENNKPRAIIDGIGNSPIIPSIVAVDNRNNMQVGFKAENDVDMKGQGVREVKRLMGTTALISLGGQSYRPEEISARILQRCKQVAEIELGEIVSKVVITVPAIFDNNQRDATREAARIAGLEVDRIVQEPTAAAMAYGINHLDDESTIAVLDLGGGTFDVSVLKMMEGVLDVYSSYGDPFLGGKDFDQKIIDHLIGEFYKQYPEATVTELSEKKLKKSAIKAKIELSSQEKTRIYLESFGSNNGKQVDLENVLNRDTFERICHDLLDRFRKTTLDSLAKKKVSAADLDKVLLVGGATYMPCIRKIANELFGTKVCMDVDPELAVSMGASIQSAIVNGILDDLIISDVASFGFGIDMLTQIGQQLVLTYVPLVKTNEKIPISIKRTFSLLHAEQTELEISVFQTLDDNIKFLDQARKTKHQMTISEIPCSSTGEPHPIEVELHYDIDGLIKIDARIPATNQSVKLSFNDSELSLSDEEIKSMRDRLELQMVESGGPIKSQTYSTPSFPQIDSPKELNRSNPPAVEIDWEAAPRAKQFKRQIEKGEARLEEMAGKERNKLELALVAMKRALVKNNDETIDQASEDLVDILFEFDV